MSHMFHGLGHTDYVNRSAVKVTASNDPTLWTPYLKTSQGNFTQFWSQMYVRS